MALPQRKLGQQRMILQTKKHLKGRETRNSNCCQLQRYIRMLNQDFKIPVFCRSVRSTRSSRTPGTSQSAHTVNGSSPGHTSTRSTRSQDTPKSIKNKNTLQRSSRSSNRDTSKPVDKTNPVSAVSITFV